MRLATLWMVMAMTVSMEAAAQDAPATAAPTSVGKAEAAAPADLVRALDLPRTADRARRAGVPDAEVGKAVKAAKE